MPIIRKRVIIQDTLQNHERANTQISLRGSAGTLSGVSVRIYNPAQDLISVGRPIISKGGIVQDTLLNQERVIAQIYSRGPVKSPSRRPTKSPSRRPTKSPSHNPVQDPRIPVWNPLPGGKGN